MKERLHTYRRSPGLAIVTPAPEQERQRTAVTKKTRSEKGMEARVFKLDRREEICVWCVNRNRESCGPCRVQGAYGYLEPDTLAVGEQGPELRPYRELRQWPAEARLAMLYLVVHYAALQGC